MVTRSSLDPIEEARARIRLRFQRATRAHPGMRQIGLSAERIGRKSGAKKLPPSRSSASAGARLPGSNSTNTAARNDSVAARMAACSPCSSCPDAAPMVQHQSETLRQRVSVSAGGDITAIKIKQGALGNEPAKPMRRKTRPLTRAEREALQESAARIQDDKLRAAIVALGEAMLTAEDTPPADTFGTGGDLPFRHPRCLQGAPTC